MMLITFTHFLYSLKLIYINKENPKFDQIKKVPVIILKILLFIP